MIMKIKDNKVLKFLVFIFDVRNIYNPNKIANIIAKRFKFLKSRINCLMEFEYGRLPLTFIWCSHDNK